MVNSALTHYGRLHYSPPAKYSSSQFYQSKAPGLRPGANNLCFTLKRCFHTQYGGFSLFILIKLRIIENTDN